MADDRLLVCFRCSHLPHDKGECSECDCYVVSGGVSFIKQWENAHGVAPPGQGWSVTFRTGVDGRVIPDSAVLVNMPGFPVLDAHGRNRVLAALWNIRVEAERLTVDGDVTAFLQRIIHHAESGMAGQRTEAQQAAHNQERGT